MVVLVVVDLVNLYGVVLFWLVLSVDGIVWLGCKVGVLVVLVDGELVWFFECGGWLLLMFIDDFEVNYVVVIGLVDLVIVGCVVLILVEWVDGMLVL